MKYSVSFLPDPFPAKGLVSLSCQRACIPFLPKGLYPFPAIGLVSKGLVSLSCQRVCIQRACIPFLPKGLYPFPAIGLVSKGLVSLSCQRVCIQRACIPFLPKGLYPFPAKGLVSPFLSKGLYSWCACPLTMVLKELSSLNLCSQNLALPANACRARVRNQAGGHTMCCRLRGTKRPA